MKYLLKRNQDSDFSSSAIYALGVFGAAFYYIQNATSFFNGVGGIFKAFIWPATILFKVLELLQV